MSHVVFRCAVCGTGYAVAIERLLTPLDNDAVACYGVVRITPEGAPPDPTRYLYERCEAVYSLQTLMTYWVEQGEGPTFVIPK